MGSVTTTLGRLVDLAGPAEMLLAGVAIWLGVYLAFELLSAWAIRRKLDRWRRRPKK